MCPSASGLAALIILLMAIVAQAQEVIHIGGLGSPDPTDLSSVSGQCSLDRTRTALTCSMVRVDIRRAEKPEAWPQAMKKFELEMEKEPLSKTPAEMGKEIAKICQEELTRQQQEVERDLERKDIPDGWKQYMKQSLTAVLSRQKELCGRPTINSVRDMKEWFKEWFKAMMLPIVEILSKICNVTTYSWQETFSPQGEGQWVNHESTACGVRISTLQQDQQKKYLGIVSYETRAVATSREDPICHGVSETPARYSLTVPLKTLPCEFITSGWNIPFAPSLIINPEWR